MDNLDYLPLDLPPVLNNHAELSRQAKYLRNRFEQSGDPTDLENAIKYQTQATAFINDSLAETPMLLCDLGNMLGQRFARSGNLTDIDKAIEHQQRALVLLPDGHAETPRIMNSLGLSLRRRYGRLGAPVDIDMAIGYQKRAAAMPTKDEAELADILNNLGNSLGLRFQRVGDLDDIENAIEFQTRCINTTPHDHPERPKFLNNLGNSFWRRFERLEKLDDLTHAIEYRQQAVALLPEGYPEKHRFLNNLGVAFFGRFERLGDLNDLEQAIRHLQEVLELRPSDHPDRYGPLDNLGICFRSRFERLGEFSDVDQAIKYQQEAILSIPDSHARKPNYFINIAQTLISRFAVLGNETDLERAIQNLQQANSLLPNGHTEKLRALQNLGDAYLRRFELVGSKLDIDEAIQHHQLTVSLLPDGHAQMAASLGSLGHSFLAKYQRFEDLTDLEEAIKHHSAALSVTPEDSPNLPKRFINLASAFQIRFDRIGSIPDLDKSIEYHLKAISLIPEDHPYMAHWLACAGYAIESRFRHTGDRSDMNQAIECFQQAAQATNSLALHRFQAARRWILLLSELPNVSTLDAYQLVMNMLPALVWQGYTIKRRYQDIIRLGDFVTEATGAAIATGRYALAFEWFEEGRSIVWRQRLQLRQPLEILHPAKPVFARHIKTMMNELEVAVTREYALFTPDQVVSLEEAAQEHRRLAKQWLVLADYCARTIPGLENFSKPKTFAQLAEAARSGSVVVVNIHKTRCDAIALLTSGEIVHVPIPSYSYEKAAKAHADWTGNLKRFGVRDRGVKRHNDSNKPSRTIFARILTDLWMGVVRPILEALGLLRIHPGKPLPRLTWCITGPLNFLPIHAAGSYNSTQPKQRIFDYLVSSYASTLSALLVLPKSLGHFRGILAIGQSMTPNKSDLPFVVEEVERVSNVASEFRFQRLTGADATVSAVLEGLEKHSWVHFACHATQDVVDPNESGFYVQDGRLSLAMITKQPLKHASFAYLSACETATGHTEIPGEAIHLAAGMLMAGFETVIGTMWAMKDEHGPVIAKQVYAELLKDDLPDSRRAAEALHNAVAHLRNQVGEDRYEEWAPFIHMGV